MEITIGRDAATSHLKISGGGKTVMQGEQGSVPVSVSRQHCMISVADDGKMTLRNVQTGNWTFVNGTAVEIKRINRGDKIELGADKYALSWEKLEEILPKVADIRPLKKVWDEYENGTFNLQVSERRFNSLRGFTPIITIGAMLLGIFTGRDNPWLWPLYGAAIVLSIGFFLLSMKKVKEVPTKQKEMRKKLQDEYVCPCCHHFFGFTDYSILSQNDACPHCKTRFEK